MKNNNIVYLKVLLFALITLFIMISVYTIVLFKNDNGFENTQKQDTDSEESVKKDIPVNFNDLKRKNSDIYAWIKIPNSNIDYPILRNEEEDYYLTHSEDKKESVYGAIYTQNYNCDDFSDSNTVIYGHNMKNGTMFGGLKKYREEAYFANHSDIIIYLPDKILKYKVFAAYTSDDANILTEYDFKDYKQIKEYLNKVFVRASGGNWNKDIQISETDKIVTLSTCTDNASKRYLVQAVLVDTIGFDS